MRCLHVADLHYDLQKFDWVVDAADDVDLIILAGDHLEISNYIKREAQAVVVRKYFQRIQNKTPLIVCSGNHDLDHRDEYGELSSQWIHNARLYGIPTDGDSPEIADTLYSICPWWDGENSKYDVFKQLEIDSTRRGKCWIWIHHAPPEDSPTSWGGRISYGDEDLRKWIEKFQPDYVLSGHVHQSPYVKDGSWADRIGRTWVFNGGHQPGRVPSHVLIDTDAGQAFWKSAYGAEILQLSAPLRRPIDALREGPEWVHFMDRLAIARPG